MSGLASSEAVVFDPPRDVYFVSNMNGDAGVKDGNGFITRITADGVVDSLHFIQGSRNGVTLNAPMGSRIQGDTLWVLDVDVLRGFDARTGAPIRTIDLAPAGAGFLNLPSSSRSGMTPVFRRWREVASSRRWLCRFRPLTSASMCAEGVRVWYRWPATDSSFGPGRLGDALLANTHEDFVSPAGFERRSEIISTGFSATQ